MFLHPKKSIIKKKTLCNPSKMKHSVSFASTTTNTSQLKSNTSVLKKQNIHPVIKSPQLSKKLSILSDEDNLKDTRLEELLEIEGKKMLSNLSETFKNTSEGKFIINTQVFRNNKDNIENKEYISNLLCSKRIKKYFSPDNSTVKKKIIYQKIIEKDIIKNKPKEKHQKKKAINKNDIVNFLINAAEEKKIINHNKANSNGMFSSTSRSQLSYVPSNRSIYTKVDKSLMRSYKI